MDADTLTSIRDEIAAETQEENQAAAVEQAPPAPAVDPAQSLAGLLSVLGIAAGYAGLEKTAAIWTPDTCKGLADKLVPVLVKYAWGQRLLAFLESGAGVEEMALVAYAAPLVLATMQAVKADMQPAPKAVQQQPQPQAAE